MPRYVDGFLIPLPKKNLPSYRRIAARAAKVWREHGALDYKECVGDDLKPKGISTFFPALAKTKPGEVVIFSFIVYKSRAHRDRVNAKVMKDPRLNAMMGGAAMPFDLKRMAYGGFNVIVDG